MSSVLQTATRSATRAFGRKPQAMQVGTSKTYATHAKIPPSQGGNNRTIYGSNQLTFCVFSPSYSAIAVAGLTLPALYLFSSRSASGTHPTAEAAQRDAEAAQRRAASDPAAKARARKEELAASGGQPKHIHPEHLDPETYKPAFGRQHQRKRVDGPPDGRNHQALNDRNANI
ncbi:hypothetical protein PG999_005170 [Apiospora kogelbergensis]|uniref:Uncharacterized protein n=1 Tax=Apiospora kogelbergensis TaxID=1337665 RepID=A0AAW0R1D6_9PEZI